MTTIYSPAEFSALPLREQARVEREVSDRERAAVEAAEREKQLDERTKHLTRELHRNFGVEPEYIIVEPTDDPQAHVQDLVFALRDRPYADTYSDRNRLHVATTCERGCGQTLWIEAESLWELDSALNGQHAHRHDCLVKYDDDGEPITDRMGNPLPPRQPVQPRYTPEQQARMSIAAIENAAERLAEAINRVTQLEDNRALVKADAIKRLVESGAASSATAAEKIVEKDEGYAHHRLMQRDAEYERHRAIASFEAAKLTARLDVSLVQPEGDCE